MSLGLSQPVLPDPTQALLDLRLPPRLLDVFVPILAELGLALQEGQLPSRFGAKPRAYTFVQNQAGTRAFFHIANWILGEPQYFDAVFVIGYDLMIPLRGAALFLLSEGVDSPHLIYRKMVQDKWSNDFGVRTRFVPWRDIEDLTRLSLADQKPLLVEMFEIQPLLRPGGASRDVTTMSYAETRQVAEVLAGLTDFDTPANRAVMIKAAGLEHVLADLDLTGSPREVAQRLINYLIEAGPLPSTPPHQALGELLDFLLALHADLRLADAALLKNVITKYALRSSD